jgi:hypothetical protein
MNYNVPDEFKINFMTDKTKTKNKPKKYKLEDIQSALESELDAHSATSIDNANYWVVELLANYGIQIVINTLVRYYYTRVSYLNPPVIAYIIEFQDQIKRIKKHYIGQPKNIVNHQNARNLICEFTSILAVSKKHTHVVSVSSLGEKQQMTSETAQLKIQKIIEIIAPHLVTNSDIYYHFQHLIIGYLSTLGSVTEHLDWLITDTTYTHPPFTQYKVPSSVATRSVFLVWRLLLRLLETSGQHQKLKVIETLMDVCVDYLKLDAKISISCVQLAIQWMQSPEIFQATQLCDYTLNPLVISQISLINFTYREVNDRLHGLNNVDMSSDASDTEPQKTQKPPKEKKPPKLSKSEQSRVRFQQNPLNQMYLTMMNDTSGLLANPIRKTLKPRLPTTSSDAEDMIIPMKTSSRNTGHTTGTGTGTSVICDGDEL